MSQKLKDFLRATPPETRVQVAATAGTTVAYLYQLAGGHRTNPGVDIALGIERATAVLHAADPSIPLVRVEDLVRAGAP